MNTKRQTISILSTLITVCLLSFNAEAYNVNSIPWGNTLAPFTLTQDFKGDHRVALSSCSFPNNHVVTEETYKGLANWNEVAGTQQLFRSYPEPIQCSTSLQYRDDSSKSQIFLADLDPSVNGIAFTNHKYTWDGSRIKQFDIYMNYNNFSGSSTGASVSEYSTCYEGAHKTYQSTLLHELGHGLGFAHSQRGRFAHMRTRSNIGGYYCNGTGVPGRANKTLTLPHPDDIAALRYSYGNTHDTHSLGVMAYVLDQDGAVRRAGPFGIKTVCAGEVFDQAYGIANR